MILKYINPIQYIVLLTYCFGLISLSFKKKNNVLLFAILTIGLFTELITIYLGVSQKMNFIPILYSMSIGLFFPFWCYTILSVKKNIDYTKIILLLFFAFAIANMFFIQGYKVFNHYTFIFGTLLYGSLYAKECFVSLKNEDFKFLFSNEFILISAPLFLMIGLTLMFAFVNGKISDTKLFNDMTLYTIVADYVNVIYYILINLYIIRERKMSYE